MTRHLQSSLWFGLLAGVLIALFSLPVFANLGLLERLGLSGSSLVFAVFGWCLFVPLAVASGLKVLSVLPLPLSFSREFVRYGIIGVLNTLLNISIFNLLMFISGVTRGPLIALFSIVTFTIVITHAFLWNKFSVFHSAAEADTRRQYMNFFLVSGTTALVNTVLIYILINVVGPGISLDAKLWANIVILLTIPVSFAGNFLGYKFIVFKSI